MRVAFTCHDAFPSSGTNTQQIFWSTNEVARLGAAIDLVVPALGAGAASASVRQAIGRCYGVDVGRIAPLFTVRPLGERDAQGWRRKGLFDARLPRHLAGGGYDLVWTRDPVAAAACVRAGLPTVFETYRPDFAAFSRFAPWRRACLQGASLRGVIVHSRIARDAFVQAGVAADRCLLAYNGFDEAQAAPALSVDDARRRVSLLAPDLKVGPTYDTTTYDTTCRHLVVYAGGTDAKKGVDAIVRLAALVPSAQFLILGADPASNDGQTLAQIAQQVGAQNVVLRPRVPPQEVWPYLYAADCLILPPTDAPQRKYRRTVLPIKLFGYLAAGRPILAPRLDDVTELLTDGENARLVAADDLPAAAHALSALLADPVLSTRLASAARATSLRYTWTARAKLVVEFLNRVL